jgi:hypothetical protein
MRPRHRLLSVYLAFGVDMYDASLYALAQYSIRLVVGILLSSRVIDIYLCIVRSPPLLDR